MGYSPWAAKESDMTWRLNNAISSGASDLWELTALGGQPQSVKEGCHMQSGKTGFGNSSSRGRRPWVTQGLNPASQSPALVLPLSSSEDFSGSQYLQDKRQIPWPLMSIPSTHFFPAQWASELLPTLCSSATKLPTILQTLLCAAMSTNSKQLWCTCSQISSEMPGSSTVYSEVRTWPRLQAGSQPCHPASIMEKRLLWSQTGSVAAPGGLLGSFSLLVFLYFSFSLIHNWCT